VPGPVDEPVAVRLRRGEALPPGTRSVARPSRWGNPFRGPTTPAGRATSVARYREWLAGEHPEVRAAGGRTGPETAAAAARELVGWNLACYCPLDGGACHRDVLLEIARVRG
jgi:Domain of unknown function (DUF4326)